MVARRNRCAPDARVSRSLASRPSKLTLACAARRPSRSLNGDTGRYRAPAHHDENGFDGELGRNRDGTRCQSPRGRRSAAQHDRPVLHLGRQCSPGIGRVGRAAGPFSLRLVCIGDDMGRDEQGDEPISRFPCHTWTWRAATAADGGHWGRKIRARLLCIGADFFQSAQPDASLVRVEIFRRSHSGIECHTAPTSFLLSERPRRAGDRGAGQGANDRAAAPLFWRRTPSGSQSSTGASTLAGGRYRNLLGNERRRRNVSLLLRRRISCE